MRHPDFKLAQFCITVAQLSAGLAAGPRGAPLPYPAWQQRRQLVRQIRSANIVDSISFKTITTTVDRQSAKWHKIAVSSTCGDVRLSVLLELHPKNGEDETWKVYNNTDAAQLLTFYPTSRNSRNPWTVVVDRAGLLYPASVDHLVALFKKLAGFYRPLRSVAIERAYRKNRGFEIDLPVAQFMP